MGPDEPIAIIPLWHIQCPKNVSISKGGWLGGMPQGRSGMLITLLLMILELLMLSSQLHNVKTSHPSRALNSIEYAHTHANKASLNHKLFTFKNQVF